MMPCTEQMFNHLLEVLREDARSGLTGPFIHAAPAGNMFRGPFREQAWMIGRTVVLMRVWEPESGWRHYQAAEGAVS